MSMSDPYRNPPGSRLRPFWRYYGGKWRLAPKYPKPTHRTIIEPFAGAAGYSMLYPEHDVVLCDVFHSVAETWRYLIGSSAEEIMRIPLVESVDALPSWVPEGGRYLVGWQMNAAAAVPCRTLSSGRRKMAAEGRVYEGWTEATRASVALGVTKIKHWRVFEAEYLTLPNAEATWFVDPPYNNPAGSHYRHSAVDFSVLGKWCMERSGQVIVCENAGADWLPFRPLHAGRRNAMTGKATAEVVWARP